MTAADEFRNDAELLFARLADARGCIHVREDGAMGDHTATLAAGELCVEAPDFAAAMDELRGLVDETAARVDALTDAAEQLHHHAHNPWMALALCPVAPCCELRRYLPNAHGVVPG
jgi:hypothetical protein